MKSFDQGLDELQKVLELGRQQWLLGAGASVESGIPLMFPLTERVEACLDGDDLALFRAIMGDLPAASHVEHTLSHLGDLIALASRSKDNAAEVAGNRVALRNLEKTYHTIVQTVARTVRYGYRAASATSAEEIGEATDPIVDVDAHLRFVRQIFKSRSNLEPRSQVGFITTNYDTLLEDALAMDRRVALDGFAGSAIAFWTGESISPNASAINRSHRVLKLHGSVDWFRHPELGLLRVRYGVKYLSDLASTLIYPQATKYLETQKDPFATIFDCFRRVLSSPDNYMLGIVGYSFGDDHINAEIRSALENPNNKAVVVAFSREVTDGAGTSICPTLQSWLNNPKYGSRIYAATDKALYNGNHRAAPPGGALLDWWMFKGLINFLETGEPA